MQSRMDSLMQQKQMIEQQLQALQQYQIPPININNQITPNNNMPGAAASFDFNGKWVANENEAKGIANNNLPLILFDKNDAIFYMKNLDGSFKKFRFTEVVDQPQVQNDDRIAALENKFDALLAQLTQAKVNTPTAAEQAPAQAKTRQKGGNDNG